MKKGAILFGIVISLVFIRPLSASVFDPKTNWQTIKTAHFFIHYPKEIESVAQDAARIFEEVYAELTPKLNWKPWGKTQVVLTDSTDDSNGLTFIIPYNWIVLYIAQPQPDTSLANYDDWLRTLIVHEYTHVLQLDPARGFWKPFRMIFGKLAAPTGVVPTWAKEGFAVYEETVETTAGRNRSTFSDMLVRTAILENDFPTIDEADGLGWKWPASNTAYLFGGKFIEYLVDTYGEDKFLEFNRRVQSSPLLSMVNHQARNIYHKTFYELWREWRATLQDKYGTVKEGIEKDGLTETKKVVVPKWDEQFRSPAPSPDGQKIAYIAASPHRKTEIRIKDLETGREETIGKRDADRVAWSPDGKKIVYSAMASYKRFYRYFDLWLYDTETKKTKKLTGGARARDPSFDPSSDEIIYVTGDGSTDHIRRVNLKTKEVMDVTSDEPKYAHFADPKISPDGTTIAVNSWKKGEGWKIYVYSLNGSWKKRLTNKDGAETSPWWSPDGKYIYYTSDEGGVSNVYRADVKNGAATKITNVLTGVFEPATLDGKKIFVREYHAQGFIISSFEGPTPPKQKGRVENQVPTGKEKEVVETKEVEELTAYPTRKYTPFGQTLLLPRYLMPYAVYLEDAFLLSLATGGADSLSWHNWALNGSYRTDAKHFGYYASYWYNRWRPIVGVGINDYAVDFGNFPFPYRNTKTKKRWTKWVKYYEERRNANAFLAIPIKNQSFNVSYFYEDRMPITKLTQPEKDYLNLGVFAGFVTSYIYGDAERYSASISPENGRYIRLSGLFTDSVLGGGEKNEQKVFSGDWREYVRLWRHHIFALRATGGMAWGDELRQGTFGVGGAIGEGFLAGNSSFNYFPLRGIPVSAISSTRAMVLSGEYRLPIVSPQRGVGTWPFYFKNLHAAFFADYGNGWDAYEKKDVGFVSFFDDFLLGVGTELRGDFVIGHGLPLTGRLGYGIIVLNRDRITLLKDPLLKTALKYGTLILQIGTSF